MQKIDIINLALARLGLPTISSLTEGSEEAAKASMCWEGAVDATLQAYRWDFNTRRTALALISEDPDGYPYRYCYGDPANMVQAYAIFDDSPGHDRIIPFIHENRCIYTDQADAILIYGVRETAVSKFSPQFNDALAWRLVGDMAMALTQRTDLAKQAEQLFQQALSKAATLAANGRRQARRLPSYIRARV